MTPNERLLRDVTEDLGDPRVAEGVETPDGSQWDIVILREGVSKNNVRYRRAVIESAIKAYEGKPIYVDHDETPRRYGRRTNDLAGFLRNVHTREREGVCELVGTACITATRVRESFLNAWRLGNPGLYGFSHHVIADKTPMVLPGGIQGHDISAIVDDEANSVDVVTRPSAGGRLGRLVASVQTPPDGEGDTMRDRMLEAIRQRPEVAAKLGTDPTDDVILTLYAEAIKPAPPPVAEAVVVNVAAQPPAVPAGMHVISEAEWTRTEQRFARLTLRDALNDCALHPPTKARIHRRFAARIDRGDIPDESEIIEAIKEAVDEFAKLEEGGIIQKGGPLSVQIGQSEHEKAVQNLDDFFEGKTKGANSIREAYIALTGDTRVTGEIREAKRLREAVQSGTFDQIMADSISRRMIKIIEEAGTPMWKGTIADVVPLNDFRTQRRVRMGGYGNLSTVGQGQPYPALTTPGDEEVTYAPAKRGGTETVTLEAIKNDDVGVVRRIPQAMAAAAMRTLNEFVFDFMGNNSTIYDTVALAASGHTNIVTTALSAANISALRLKIAQQADISNSKRGGLEARYLWVPMELQQLAFELLTPAPGITTANFLATLGLQPRVVPYWTDTNNYWMTASVDQAPMIEVGFLDGQEDPEIFVQDQPTQGSMFSHDVLTYKIRHIYGGAVMDFRPFAAGIVA